MVYVIPNVIDAVHRSQQDVRDEETTERRRSWYAAYADAQSPLLTLGYQSIL